jgi:predicted RNA-binding Zn-ribbon protein involved in translation (DUF1610 family)
MAKQDCPFCGKPNIDGRHINMCLKNPKNIPEVEIPKPKGGMMVCPNCGGEATRLNALDCRCPKCGDIEFVRVSKP